MDGYQLCREWRADPKLGAIPLVFYTANYTESDDERFAKSVGADRFLVKPMDPNSLLKAVDELLNLTERGDYTTPVIPEVDESKVLKEYNARLVNKLERQLEETRTTNLELTRTASQLLDAEQALRGVFWPHLWRLSLSPRTDSSPCGTRRRKTSSDGLPRTRSGHPAHSSQPTVNTASMSCAASPAL